MRLLFALSATFSLASSLCGLPTAQKRSAQSEEGLKDLIDLNTPYGPIDLPSQFLSPPWTPESDLGSPYPNNDGHSQMTDNEVPIWRQCPELHLDCRKCPRDPRCRRPHLPELHEPQSGVSSIPPEDDGQSDCPLGSIRCDDNVNTCGANAQCTRGFCLCKRGFKGSLPGAEGFRGNEGLGAVTVYAGLGVACDAPCDDFNCKEVEQLEVDVCFRTGAEMNCQGYDVLETDDVASGSVNLPTYDGLLGSKGDYVAGVAGAGGVGEAN